jgi:hypothetical protein
LMAAVRATTRTVKEVHLLQPFAGMAMKITNAVFPEE